jgi:RNA recognition motif-containing protein
VNIYVGGIPRSATEAELKTAFEAFGPVTSASIIKDRMSGQSREFGFVEMPDSAQAQAAISGLNGKPLSPGARPLTVNEARPRPPRGSGGGGFGGGGERRGGFGGGDRRGGPGGGRRF